MRLSASFSVDAELQYAEHSEGIEACMPWPAGLGGVNVFGSYIYTRDLMFASGKN